jgi:hypothetical protein
MSGRNDSVPPELVSELPHHATTSSRSLPDGTWEIGCWCGATFAGETHGEAHGAWERHQANATKAAIRRRRERLG